MFSYEDHKNLSTMDSLFKLQRVTESEFNADKHKFYRYLADAYGRGKSLKNIGRHVINTLINHII